MSGILGTQICASLFLGSFLIIEAVMTWSNTCRNTTIRMDSQTTDLDNSTLILRRYTLIFSLGSSLALILAVLWTHQAKFWIFWALLGIYLAMAILIITLTIRIDSQTREINDFALMVNLSIPFATAFLFIPLWTHQADIMMAWTSLGFYLTMAILIGTLSMVGLLKSCESIGGVWRLNPILFFPALLICYVISLGGLVAPESYILWIIFSDYIIMLDLCVRSGLFPPLAKGFWHILFILFQIFAAFLTYLCMYDPVGTYKPGWTNQLG